jgi:hypothetical protein
MEAGLSQEMVGGAVAEAEGGIDRPFRPASQPQLDSYLPADGRRWRRLVAPFLEGRGMLGYAAGLVPRRGLGIQHGKDQFDKPAGLQPRDVFFDLKEHPSPVRPFQAFRVALEWLRLMVSIHVPSHG